MISRRQFVVGGAAVAAATLAGGGAAFALDAKGAAEDGREAAWNAATGDERILMAATLAPSSHNMQPWRFRTSTEHVDLLADPERTMGAADPRGRELHVSLGCALENMAIATAASGRGFTISHEDGAEREHFERLSFAAGQNEYRHADLASAIPVRRTNRAAFDASRAVDAATLGALGERVDAEGDVRVVWVTSAEQRAAFTDLSTRATERHLADAAMQRDSHRWYRMKAADAERERDGITVKGANLPPIGALFFTIMPPSPDSFDAGWAKATAETHCGTAPAFGLLVVKKRDDRAAWVDAGRAYQRIQLDATARGLATHPISQALALRDREIAEGAPGEFARGLEALAGPGEVVLAFRIGYPTREQSESLRRTPVVERG